jgi:F-type H+-transporting ATPase subunit a
MAVGLTALEFLVAALQAYVFTVLTCIYLNDALHPGH